MKRPQSESFGRNSRAKVVFPAPFGPAMMMAVGLGSGGWSSGKRAGRTLSLLIPRFEDLNEGVLGDVHLAEGFHLGLTLFLLLEEFALSGDVAAVAFGGDVFAHGADRFPGDDVATNRGLDGDNEHLGRDDFLEFGSEFATAVDGFVAVNDGGEGFDGIAGDEHVHFDHVGGAVAGMLVVHGAIAFGHGFKAVVEIDEDVGERNGGGEEDAEFVDGLGVFQFASLFHDELHGISNVVAWEHDEDANHGLTDFLDGLLLGEIGGIVDDQFFAVGFGDLVDYAGVGGDDIHVELTAESFLDDFHVEEAEESAAEAEAEGGGGFGLEGEGGVVDLELAHRDFEGLVVGGVDGVDAGKDHGADFFESGKGLGAGLVLVSDGVADFDFGGGLHVGDDVADVSGLEFLGLGHLGGEVADFLDLVVGGSVEEFDLIAFLHLAGNHTDVRNDAAVGIIKRVEDGGAEEPVGGLGGWGNEFNDGFEDFLNANAHFGGSGDAVLARDGEDFLELLSAAIDVGGGEVDLVENGDDGEVLLHGKVDVGHGLGFDALGGIDDEDGAFARGEGAGDLVGKIDVSGGVEEVELVGFAVFGFEGERDRVGLDGDALLPLEVHGVEVLGL